MPDGDTNRARALTSRKNVREGVSGLGGRQTATGVRLRHHRQTKLVVGKHRWHRSEEVARDRRGWIRAGISPDGRYFVFFLFRSQTPQIWRTDLDGGNPKQLTDESGIRTCQCLGREMGHLHTFGGGIKKVRLTAAPLLKLCCRIDTRSGLELSPPLRSNHAVNHPSERRLAGRSRVLW